MVTTQFQIPPELTTRFDHKRVFVAVCSIAFLTAVVAMIAALGRMTWATSDRDFILQGQAAQIARSGLTEATNWFRRQPSQPVVVFAPTELDSLDPNIGIVREFVITDTVWGRFEVWRGPDGTEMGLRKRFGAEDVSLDRGHQAPGAVWRLHSVGYVFEREHADQPFDRNRVLHREVLEVEVSRVGVRLPGQAALCVRDGSRIEIGRNAEVAGGAAAVGIYHGPLAANTRAAAASDGVTGVASIVPAASAQQYDDRIESVFGVDRESLALMADDHVTHPSYFPAQIPTGSIYFVDVKDLDCTAGRPLRGHGIVFVAGNLTLSPGSASKFAGLLYVDGDLVIRSGTELSGAVVVTGSVSIQSASGIASVRYDDSVLQALVGTVGAYRMSSPVTRVTGRDAAGQ